ncbi:GTP cyclohydrolase I [Metallosphaera hakonensis]|uniref:GTP cyclohydrolase 1 n=1 Tax=Metallosphaera hakonensis JCM 8857 = DSM 7519 TaxID=1293036 RepID=A0A2U9IVS0_9CREN|nr:GTP cyclohydrolase I [Metallosphaera hakonensis]AWS00063.1 GTP cyclohydrolase I FolE [Metallosphaera hakonensis JCM 8857 = DSM 7519]
METSLSKEKLEEEIAKRVREILELLGENPDREGLAETPNRVARAFLEMTSALRTTQPEIKVFNLGEDGAYYEEDQIVLASDIQFSSLCEHHLLPFIGKIHVAYVVGDERKVAGFSKIIRTVNFYASKPQIQERLVSEIADAIMQSDLNPKGVMVVGDAIHMCSYVRGVKDKEAKLLSVATRGVFKSNRGLRNYVFKMLEISSKKGMRLG